MLHANGSIKALKVGHMAHHVYITCSLAAAAPTVYNYTPLHPCFMFILLSCASAFHSLQACPTVAFHLCNPVNQSIHPGRFPASVFACLFAS